MKVETAGERSVRYRDDNSPGQLSGVSRTAGDIATRGALSLSQGWLRTAASLEKVADTRMGVERLLALVRQVPDNKTRIAIFEALGFDGDVARGLAWRVGAKLMGYTTSFFNERGFISIDVKLGPKKYGPSLADMQQTLREKALELRMWANCLGAVAGRFYSPTSTQDNSTDLAQVASWVNGMVQVGNLRAGSKLLGGATTLASIVMSVKSMLSASEDCKMAQLLALHPASNLGSLAAAYYSREHEIGKGILNLITFGIPGNSLLIDVVDWALPDDRPAQPSDGSLAGILDRAATGW